MIVSCYFDFCRRPKTSSIPNWSYKSWGHTNRFELIEKEDAKKRKEKMRSESSNKRRARLTHGIEERMKDYAQSKTKDEQHICWWSRSMLMPKIVSGWAHIWESLLWQLVKIRLLKFQENFINKDIWISDKGVNFE